MARLTATWSWGSTATCTGATTWVRWRLAWNRPFSQSTASPRAAPNPNLWELQQMKTRRYLNLRLRVKPLTKLPRRRRAWDKTRLRVAHRQTTPKRVIALRRNRVATWPRNVRRQLKLSQTQNANGHQRHPRVGMNQRPHKFLHRRLLQFSGRPTC